jgi:glycosyltransferase involved in cell wall biosynthesis
MHPTVSVIIPCYNHAQYLADCIKSVRLQTFQDFEILVVNDCGTDNIREVCRDLGVSIHSHYENKGVSAARNSGIRKASGDYIMCLDADDMINEHYLERLVHRMEADRLDMVGSWLITFGDGNIIWWGHSRNAVTFSELRVANRTHSGTLFRKSMWKALNGFDETMRHGLEDWEFWLRAVQKGYKLGIHQEALYLYRKGSGTLFDVGKAKEPQIREYIYNKLRI